MCSLEDAWGVTEFMGSEVESQADDRVNCMKTPDNLFYPKTDYDLSPLTKPLPGKNKYTRGVQSTYSRKQRIPNKVHEVRGGNGDMSVGINPIMHQKGTSNTPLLNEINESFYDPHPVANDNSLTNLNDAFNVSGTVDRFMNMGMDMTDSPAPVNYSRNVNNSWQDMSDPDRMDRHVDTYDENNGNGSIAAQNNEQYVENMNDNITVEQLKLDNEEVIKLLGDVLHKLDNLERKVNNNKTVNIHDMILYMIVLVLVITVLFLAYK
jgi:hypothetical protein